MYLWCFRSEGSSAKQCSGYEGKISKSELCTGTPKKYCIDCVSEVKAQVQISAVVPKKDKPSELCIGTAPALPSLLCVSKAKIVFTVCPEAQSSKVWPKLELESSGHATPRAGAPFRSKTSSGSSDLEPNLERELRFGAKPRAGAMIWSHASSGSAFEVQNLERERL